MTGCGSLLLLLQVTVVEACLTLLQFVLLLVIGWAVDVKVWNRVSPDKGLPPISASSTDVAMVSFGALTPV